jgi:carboxymethylenebutenolidase
MNGETNDGGDEIDFAGGDAQLRGVLFRTATPARAAVVLLPDVHGVAPLYREIGSRLARDGLTTLLLDLYSREGAPRLADFAAVQAWIAALPDRRVMRDVAAAVDHLRRDPDLAIERVGIMGFCLGGQYAMMAACRIDALDACVAFYGMLRHGTPGPEKISPPIETAGAFRCPLLGLFGGDDPLIPPSDVAAFRNGLAGSGVPFELRVFEGAGHAFANDRRPDAYRPAAATEALAAASSFLRRMLDAGIRQDKNLK